MTKANGLRAGAVALALLLAGAAMPAEAKTFRLAINADASTLDPHAQNSQVNFAILLVLLSKVIFDISLQRAILLAPVFVISFGIGDPDPW